MRNIIFTCLLVFDSFLTVSQINSPSMVMQEIVKVSGKTTENDLANLGPQYKQVTRTYLDGLGRTIQVVNVQASPSQKDIITYGKYNVLGQQLYTYLPYVGSTGNGNFRSSAASEQTSFYSNGLSDKVVDDTKPWGQVVVESSPLQRVLQAGSIGNNFQPSENYKQLNYRSYNSSVYSSNDAGAVRLWLPDGTSSTTYAANSLTVSEITDEHSNLSLVYKDYEGKVILKRQYVNETIEGTSETFLDTYYIYDDAGQLRFIVPPKAYVAMKASGFTVTLSAAAKFIYEFKYDSKGRITEKKVPGKEAEYIVYDYLNRPVLTQDGNLRAGGAKKWNYIKYDEKNRVVSQGIYTHGGSETTQSAMQSYVAGLTYTYDFEERQSTDPYYTNRVFPTSSIDPLLYNFYDDYDLDLNGSANYSYSSQSLSGEASATSNLRGILTMNRTKTVTAGTAQWLFKVMFYDNRGNLIQTKQDNLLTISLSSPGDHTTIVPSFTGQPMTVKISKTVSSVTTTSLTTYQYDHVGRTNLVQLSVNGATAVKVGEYSYNELGQLVDKKHYNASGSAVLQSVDYRYNIRGQLTSINNSDLSNDVTTYTNDETNDLFGMTILYETQDAGLGNTALYNGLISGIKWRSKSPSDGTPLEKGYYYTYDKLLRLKHSNYKDRTVGGSWGNAGIYDEKDITYDHMGNIKTLKRYTGTTTVTDDLSYSYDGNQLTNVSDANNGAGFFNGTNTNPYTYDDNGNLTADPKKGLTLSYNVINRVKTITVTAGTGKYINYTYLATGVLVKKEVYDNNTLQKTYDYIEGFVYESSTLKYFGMAEGRVRIDAGPTVKYEYMITDHLGNVRISFEDNGSGQAVATQRNNYYAFGLVLPDSYTPSNANKNLFNAGSEWQNDYSNLPDYYQTFYRNYDAVLGRFIAVDCRAELDESVTTFSYAGNNPINCFDPLGDIVEHPFVRALRLLCQSPGGGQWTAGDDGGIYDFYEDGPDPVGDIFGSSNGEFWFGAPLEEPFSIMQGGGGSSDATLSRILTLSTQIKSGQYTNFRNIRYTGAQPLQYRSDLRQFASTTVGSITLAILETYNGTVEVGTVVMDPASTLDPILQATTVTTMTRGVINSQIRYANLPLSAYADGVYFNGTISLGHELFHALLDIADFRGLSNYLYPVNKRHETFNSDISARYFDGNRDRLYWEILATNLENQLRTQLGDPRFKGPRKKYGGIDISKWLDPLVLGKY